MEWAHKPEIGARTNSGSPVGQSLGVSHFEGPGARSDEDPKSRPHTGSPNMLNSIRTEDAASVASSPMKSYPAINPLLASPFTHKPSHILSTTLNRSPSLELPGAHTTHAEVVPSSSPIDSSPYPPIPPSSDFLVISQMRSLRSPFRSPPALPSSPILSRTVLTVSPNSSPSQHASPLSKDSSKSQSGSRTDAKAVDLTLHPNPFTDKVTHHHGVLVTSPKLPVSSASDSTIEPSAAITSLTPVSADHRSPNSAEHVIHSTVSLIPAKRSQTCIDEVISILATSPKPGPSTNTSASPSKRNKSSSPSKQSNLPPAPKRTTLASQKLQHKKLTTPFRSPLISKPIPCANSPADTQGHHLALSPTKGKGKETNTNIYATPVSSRSLNPSRTPLNAVHSKPQFASSTSKAASPFKLPFISTPSSSAATPAKVPAVSTPNIQALERKVQILRRAIKIKAEGDEEKLTALIKKWRDAGKEVAWELWSLVREEGQVGNGGGWGESDLKQKKTKTKFTVSWGWDEPADKKPSVGGGMRDNWGWDSSPEQQRDVDGKDEELSTFTPPSPRKLESELYRSLRKKPAVERKTMLPPTPRGSYFEIQASARASHGVEDESEVGGTDGVDEENEESTEEKKRDNLGTMLLQLGIAHATLGWDEEEEDFIES